MQNKKDESLETISILMIGDTSVGKSTLLKKFITGNYSDCLNPTVGVELYKKKLNINDKNYLYRLWDTCGQERYRSLCKSYYHSADGIMILFSLNSSDSFNNLDMWLNSIKDNGAEDIPIIMVGTKCDLESNINEEEIHNFIKENILIKNYFKCSAKYNIGVEEPFIELANLVIKFKNNNENNKKVKIKIINNNKAKKKKKKCC